jgi:hypothetical protein
MITITTKGGIYMNQSLIGYAFEELDKKEMEASQNATTTSIWTVSITGTCLPTTITPITFPTTITLPITITA